MPGPGPDQPGQALPGGTPHAVRGVPGHPIGANPAQSSSESFIGPTSVVCPDRVDGNIEIPSGGTPQDFELCEETDTLEKANTIFFRLYYYKMRYGITKLILNLTVHVFANRRRAGCE